MCTFIQGKADQARDRGEKRFLIDAECTDLPKIMHCSDHESDLLRSINAQSTGITIEVPIRLHPDD